MYPLEICMYIFFNVYSVPLHIFKGIIIIIIFTIDLYELFVVFGC